MKLDPRLVQLTDNGEASALEAVDRTIKVWRSHTEAGHGRTTTLLAVVAGLSGVVEQRGPDELVGMLAVCIGRLADLEARAEEIIDGR